MRGLKMLAPTSGRVVCLLALALLALSQMGSSPGPSCNGSCFEADIGYKYDRARPHSRPTWSADGTRIAFLHRGAVYVVASDGSSLMQVVGPYLDPGPYRDMDLLQSPLSPAISPDGSKVAYIQNSSDHCEANFDIYLSDVDGSNRQRLTDHDATDTNPVWSPDGTRIAFQSDRDSDGYELGRGHFALFTMKADGSEILKVSDETSAVAGTAPAWSPDGQNLAFVATEWAEESGNRVARNNPSATPLSGTPTREVRAGLFSREVIYTVAPDGANPVKLWDGTLSPDFNPRGRSNREDWNVPEEKVEGLTWSPDGSRMAFSATVYGESPILFAMELGSRHLHEVPVPQIPRPPEYGKYWQLPVSWSTEGSSLLFWLVTNWKNKGEWWNHRTHSGIYAVSPDGGATEFLGDFPLPTMRPSWPYHPSTGKGEMGVHPSGIAVYFTENLNISSDTLLYVTDFHGSKLQPLVRRERTEDSAELIVEDEYIKSCSDFLVANPEVNPGLVGDCRTLLSLRDALGGGGGLPSWRHDRPMEQWSRVTIGGTPRRVVGLEIYAHYRIAKVYPRIGTLDALETLVLAGKGLHGELPIELGNFTNLKKLIITHTSLSGTFPPEISGMSDLEVLHLDMDNLAEPVHTELTTLENLREFLLFEDESTLGCIPTRFFVRQLREHQENSTRYVPNRNRC